MGTDPYAAAAGMSSPVASPARSAHSEVGAGERLESAVDTAGSAPARVQVSEDAVRVAATLRAACSAARNWVLIAGLRDEDGAAVVAARLAAALAQMDRNPVLLLEADLRSPGLHSLFGSRAAPGLAELLQGAVGLDDVLCRFQGSGLWFLPGGDPASDPVSALGSAGYTDLAQALRQRFRFVIGTAPPILEFPDAALLAPGSDGVVLVARAGRRSRRELREAKSLFLACNVSILGVVLSEAAGASLFRR
jgi:protein-tyrosine kinase